MKMLKNIKKYLWIPILLVILFVLYQRYYKELYHFFLINVYTRFISAPRNKYFKDNLESIIGPYYEGEVERSGKRINIEKNAKCEYSIIDKDITSDIVKNLKNTENKDIEKLLKRLMPYVHLDGKAVNYDDFIVLDVLTAKGSYFPSFHTDVEWLAFNAHDGFQIWILLEEDPEIKPRGNMFIMETDIAKRGLSIDIQKDYVNVVKNKTQIADDEVVHSFKDIGEMEPKIKYLNVKVGEVLVMNSNVFHCSDPKNLFSDRLAINMRFIHKPTEILKLGDLSNNYSRLVRTKNPGKKKGEYCEYKFNNKEKRFKFK